MVVVVNRNQILGHAFSFNGVPGGRSRRLHSIAERPHRDSVFSGSNGASKQPRDTAEESSPGTVLGREYPDAGTSAKLVGIVKDIRDIESDLDLLEPADPMQVKRMAEADVENPVGRDFVSIRKSASQATAVQHIAVDRCIHKRVREAG
jgi:hypothetical protein